MVSNTASTRSSWFPRLPGLDSRAVERRIELDGCVNFRDLGGYSTEDGRRLRWRLLFRSDALHALSETDVVRLRDELVLSDIVDLRSSFELGNEGRGLLEREPIAFHHTPLFDGDTRSADAEASMTMSLGARYLGMMDMAQQEIAGVIRILTASRAGAVYHCAAGKDRTGVISAVLLGALGVAEELIVADYVLSAERITAIIERVMNMKGYEDTLQDMPEDTLHAKPESMEEVLAGANARYGSMVEYLREGGIDDAVLGALRAKYLE